MCKNYSKFLELLKDGSNIVLCKADKKNDIFILNKIDYTEKIVVTLNDTWKFLNYEKLINFITPVKLKTIFKENLRVGILKV